MPPIYRSRTVGTRDCWNPTTVQRATTVFRQVVDLLPRNAPVTCRVAVICPSLFPFTGRKPGSDRARKAKPVRVTTTELPLNPTNEIGTSFLDSAQPLQRLVTVTPTLKAASRHFEVLERQAPDAHSRYPASGETPQTKSGRLYVMYERQVPGFVCRCQVQVTQ